MRSSTPQIREGHTTSEMKSSTPPIKEGHASEMKSSSPPSPPSEGRAAKKMKSSPPEEEQSVKSPRSTSTKAYLRVRADFTDTPIHWYSFDIGKDGPEHLTPFSIVYQPKMSTILGMNSFIYCLGGCGDSHLSEPLKSVYRYDTANPDRGWERMSDMIHGRHNPEAVAVDGKIYVIGGRIANREITIPSIFAEFYDPLTNKWTPLVVHFDGKDIFPNLIFNSGGPGLVYTAAVVDPFHILLAANHAMRSFEVPWPDDNNTPSYLLDTRSHCLQKLEKRMAIHASSTEAFVDGYTQFTIDFSSGGFLTGLRMDKHLCYQSTSRFSVGLGRPPTPGGNSILLREDGLSRCSEYAKQFHFIWHSSYAENQEEIGLYYRNIKFLEDMDPNEKKGNWDFSIKSTKTHFLPRGQYLLDGLLL